MATRIPNLLIGCAAGFSGDRTDAALPVVRELIARAQPSVLIFETLAERTLALAQLARQGEEVGVLFLELSADAREALVDDGLPGAEGVVEADEYEPAGRKEDEE